MTRIEKKLPFFGKFRNKPKTKWIEGVCHYVTKEGKYLTINEDETKGRVFNEIKK